MIKSTGQDINYWKSLVSNEAKDALEATVLMVACANREKSSSSNFSLNLVKFIIEELDADF